MSEGKGETYLLTGATGFLGGHLMAALVERGHRLIVFGRRAGATSLAARVESLLAWFSLESRSAQVETVEVDLLKRRCGLGIDRYDALCVEVDQVIHCASDTRFAEQGRRESFVANVDALQEIIRFAGKSGASCFHYVGTAYAMASTAELCREIPATEAAGRHSNVYEESKCAAEGEVVAQCGRLSVPFTIVRPSIVYGDSRTGRATRFNAIYTHVKALCSLREIYAEDIEKHGGKKSEPWGIRLDPGDVLRLPVRMYLDQPGTLSLIPVDYFVSAMLAILEGGERGRIYHLTNPSSKTIEELAAYCESYLNISGIETVYGGVLDESLTNPAEALFNRFIEPYRPYLSDIRLFDRTNTDEATGGLVPPEFSYPTATGNINTTYAGKGGVAIDSLVKKGVLAARFKTEKILLSSDITDQSRILYKRNITERVKTVAPFLRFDADAYMVVTASGRLTWIIDAYTYSKRLPYSKQLKGGINYMRNSVKVVVDAYDGSVDFYLSDPTDVIAQVYAKIFPGLLQPLAAMPQDLRKHIRYPHQFLQLQAAMFTAYHMTDPKVFYNKENLWEIPVLGEKPMEAYYTIMKLPGEKNEEYLLLLPFTPSKRDNLAAWFTARCDEPNYGNIRVYTFPRDRLIYGPKQIDARINQDSYISQQLTLWNQRGSEVIRGSMLVIPIEKSLLYVQPLFLAAADKAGLPELKRVIVAYGDQVVMEENLELALQRLFSERKEPAESAVKAGVVMKGPPATLAKEAMGIFERATQLQRQGDWTGYGAELRKLEQVLRRMAQ